MLTGGQVADCTAGAQLLERLPPCRILHGDSIAAKGSDAEWALIEPHMPKPRIRGRPREWPLREVLNGIFYCRG
jgi:hypothetical protein